MIKLYLSPSCSSCRKAKACLISNHISFEEINIRNTLISEKELFHILSLTDSGTDDIISKRSLLYQKLNLNFNDIILSEAVKIINEHQSLLKRPLIVDDKRIQIGFNEEDIRKFIPRCVRDYQKMGLYRQNL